MPWKITPLQPQQPSFAAHASGIDLRKPLDAGTIAEIDAAMDKYAVLVFRDQPLDQGQQIAFSKQFGPLDAGLRKATGAATRFQHEELIDIGNVALDGSVAAPDNKKLIGVLANQLWHSDSTFQDIPVKYSMLSAVVVTEVGGETQWADLRAAWDDGGCAAVLGVGYPKPNLSHFRGIEIWNTAADETSEQTLTDGWLSRLYHLAAASAPTDLLAHSITLSSSGAQAHEGLGPFVGHQEQNHFVIDKPEQFIKDIGVIPRLDEDPVAGRTANPALAHVRRLREEITLIGQRFSTLLKAPAPFTTVFPETSLGNQLKSAARFITSGALCPTYKCTIDGFDTHSSQRGAHDPLLKDLSGALAAFRTALKSTPGAWERTLVVTYSEFGRRARENGSEGTDHGTAAPMLLLGGRVKPGFHGTYPDLKNLVYDDLGHTTDFRSVYQGIARDFLGFKPPFLVTPGLTPLACCVPG